MAVVYTNELRGKETRTPQSISQRRALPTVSDNLRHFHIRGVEIQWNCDFTASLRGCNIYGRID
jgi:hypothetical protein